MTCDELLERLVDPASAGHGGHAPVVEHLNSCAKCRGATKAFGAIERLYKPESAGEPPKDFDNRVLGGLAEAEIRRATALRLSPALVAAIAAGVLLIGGLVFYRLTRVPAPNAPAPAAKTAPKVVAAPTEPPRPSLAGIDGPELTPEETAKVKQMHDFGFLRAVDTLAALDPFFGEDIVVGSLAGPPAPSPAALPERPPESLDQQTNRLYEFRKQPRTEKARLESLDEAYRARPTDQRVILLARWETVKGFTEEDFAGLKRLASRFEELDPKRRAKLKADIRAITAQDVDKRSARWEAIPFTKGLTGQEISVAERLLAAR